MKKNHMHTYKVKAALREENFQFFELRHDHLCKMRCNALKMCEIFSRKMRTRKQRTLLPTRLVCQSYNSNLIFRENSEGFWSFYKFLFEVDLLFLYNFSIFLLIYIIFITRALKKRLSALFFVRKMAVFALFWPIFEKYPNKQCGKNFFPHCFLKHV